MKKVLVAAFALASISASAQKGSVLVGGNFGVESAKGDGSLGGAIALDETKSSGFIVAPFTGYQFSDHWTAGVSFGIGGARQETTSGSGNYDKVSIFNVGPFVRYTKTLGNIFSFFAQGHVNYLSGTSKNYSPTPIPTDKFSGVGVNLFPAIGVNVKNGFALNFGFGGIDFTTRKWKNISGAKTSSRLNVTFGQQLNLGISKNFGGRKK